VSNRTFAQEGKLSVEGKSLPRPKNHPQPHRRFWDRYNGFRTLMGGKKGNFVVRVGPPSGERPPKKKPRSEGARHGHRVQGETKNIKPDHSQPPCRCRRPESQRKTKGGKLKETEKKQKTGFMTETNGAKGTIVK